MFQGDLVLATVAAFLAVVGGTSLIAVGARWFRRDDSLPTLEGWALAGRRFGAPTTWLLLGGTIYTAYTFAAVPGLVYGAGALGFFALPYTVIVYPLAFVLLPRLWTVARDNGYITVADYVKGRYDSPPLALAVALTGILATMPYIALQLLGIRAVLTAGGLYPRGFAGDLALIAVFAVLALATYRHGLRAPAVISIVKGAAIFGATLAVVAVVLDELGGPGRMFETAATRHTALALEPELFPAFATLALGSAMALLVYPHVLTAAFAAKGPDTLRKVTVALPAWTAVLGLFGVLGIAALAAGVEAPPGNAESAVPLLVDQLMPAALTGVLFGAFVVGALVPAAVMSIAAATAFVRNIYVEYFHPTATPKHQTRIAQAVSLTAKVGAVAFVLGLRNQDAINLQLLGGVWILQTFPAVAIGLFTTWLHKWALLAGWATGMVAGTLLVVWGGFSSVVSVGFGDAKVPVYAAVVAFALNLVVAVGLTPLLSRPREAVRAT
ncbi:sodium:solute symporter family protein [Phytohabitans houttuyneae]|uniref:sodium:solute symporter family protein n=1 Tax=Phytohabitans houttuyneae TaxID=1076126 RepID=UPI0015650465|nr:sodium:solute symporter [Phytohabitans houttuyneae]